MSIFSSIVDKIFHHPAAHAAGPSPAPAPPQAHAPSPGPRPAPQTQAPQAQPAPTAPATAPQSVDVEGVLVEMARTKGGGGDWRRSIVDLLKLLDLDSSLSARKQLADELGVHSGAAGSAEENIALHRAVMEKLAQNGGKVPPDLLHKSA